MEPRLSAIGAAVALTVWVLSFEGAVAGGAGAPPNDLQAYISRSLQASGDVRYRAAKVDLNDDGAKEIVVHVTSPEFCGSGGCVTLVLQRRAGGYRTVMRATVTRAPIRVLVTKHHGWKDIGVMVGGGGLDAYEAGMDFDGRRYPSNPTVPPARRLDHARGAILID